MTFAFHFSSRRAGRPVGHGDASQIGDELTASGATRISAVPFSTAPLCQWQAGVVLASVVQLHPVQGEAEANRARAAAFVQQAAENGSQIVVLPELFATGLPRPDEGAADIAEPPTGPTATWLGEQALSRNLAVAGTFVENAGDKLYNRLLLAMPDGTAFSYAKRKLDGSERGSLAPGSDINVADTALGRLGLSICLDASDADMAADLRAASVQAVVYPHATGANRMVSRAVFAAESHRRPLMAAFAKAVAAPVLAAGQVGPFGPRTGGGGTGCEAPPGSWEPTVRHWPASALLKRASPRQRSLSCDSDGLEPKSPAQSRSRYGSCRSDAVALPKVAHLALLHRSRV